MSNEKNLEKLVLAFSSFELIVIKQDPYDTVTFYRKREFFFSSSLLPLERRSINNIPVLIYNFTLYIPCSLFSTM